MRSGVPVLLSKLLVAAGQLATAMLIISVAINFVNVIGRYFFHHSLEWGEEVMVYLMIGSVFLAAGAISLRDTHIGMDILVGLLPSRAKFALELLNDAIQITAGLLIVYLATPVILQLFDFDQRSEALHLPVFIPQMAVPVGFGLMVAGVILRRIVK